MYFAGWAVIGKCVVSVGFPLVLLGELRSRPKYFVVELAGIDKVDAYIGSWLKPIK